MVRQSDKAKLRVKSKSLTQEGKDKNQAKDCLKKLTSGMMWKDGNIALDEQVDNVAAYARQEADNVKLALQKRQEKNRAVQQKEEAK